MIPPHQPSSGVGRVLALLLGGAKPASVEAVEDAARQACGVGGAVLLPSARAGINWALAAALGPGAAALCPAFTCAVVHEAAVRSGAQLQLIDTAADGFLMDPAALRRAAAGRYGLVLCEVYGHPYDLDALAAGLPAPPAIRIIDMAMTVPVPALVERLRGTDLAVLSLGAGKCLYAGWGGLALTGDLALADEVRRRRDAALSTGGVTLAARRAVSILVRTAGYERAAYGVLRKLWPPVPPGPSPFERWRSADRAAPEWRRPSSGPDRRLARYNLEHCPEAAARRIELAARYHRNLEGVAGVVRPPASPYALSCYTVRVRPEARTNLWRYLWGAGIAADRLFEFLPYLDAGALPNTWRRASEVINLPLFERLALSDVDRIAEHVARWAGSASAAAG